VTEDEHTDPDDFEFSDDPVEIPINGILDLHIFQPRDVKTLVPDYLEACRDKGITRIRIIHGKGKGELRRTVHAILERIEWVDSYRLADDQSSWGATIVFIRLPENSPPKADELQTM
jgi:DNA-nicking Smr family endonuclease